MTTKTRQDKIISVLVHPFLLPLAGSRSVHPTTTTSTHQRSSTTPSIPPPLLFFCIMLTRLNFLKNISSNSLQRILFGSRHVSQSQSSAIGGDLIKQALKRSFPAAANIVVQDISGGCGAMFEVYVVSDEFKGVARVKQHLAVSNALKNEIKDMHGIRIFTDVPSTAEENGKQ